MTVTLLPGDCLTLLPTLPAASVDAVITDPPYGIGYASSRTTRSDGTPRKHRAAFGPDRFCADWLAEVYRILKPDTCLYVFTRWDVAHRWKEAIEAAGFVVTQRLVWNKLHWKMGDLRYYGSQTEDVLFCRKGSPRLHYDKRRGNLFAVSSSFLPEGQYDHPAQKPERLLTQFVLDCTRPGDVILDPFAGSGSIGVAAIETGRRAILMERDPAYCAIIERRIAAAQPALLQEAS